MKQKSKGIACFHRILALLIIIAIPACGLPPKSALDKGQNWFFLDEFFIEQKDEDGNVTYSYDQEFLNEEFERLSGQKAVSKSYEKTIRLALCHLFRGDTEIAGRKFEDAAELSNSSTEETLLALLTAAEIWNVYGRSQKEESQKNFYFRRAGQLADKAQRAAPKGVTVNKHIARCRVAYWHAAGDELNKSVAMQHFESVDPDGAGIEVLDPATATILVNGAIVIVGIISTTFLIYHDKIEPDDAVKLLGGVGMMVLVK